MDATRIVIVGHVDHGKSTFSGRLLYDTQNLSPDRLAEIKKASEEHGRRMEFAFVTDQFQEERENNITIDTTQTFFNINGRPFILVDAPGHKEYLKNMITGATQAQHGVIMLDVNEGIREQTDKHARILNLLGIHHVAVMVNKMDTVKFDEKIFQRLRNEIVDQMTQFGVAPTEVIPLSAYEGDNVSKRSARMPWYKGPTALEFIESCRPPASSGPVSVLRLPVQAIFVHEGRKLLMGRVEQGTLTKGQTIAMFPSGTQAKVKDVLKFRESVTSASEGECVAVDLGQTNFKRGDVVTAAPSPAAAGILSVHAFWASPEPLKTGDKILVECRTQSATFEVLSVSDEIDRLGEEIPSLATGEVGLIRIKSTSPMLVDAKPDGAPLSRLVFHRNGQVAGCGVVAHAA